MRNIKVPFVYVNCSGRHVGLNLLRFNPDIHANIWRKTFHLQDPKIDFFRSQVEVVSEQCTKLYRALSEIFIVFE